ncbi:MAG: glycerophosphodiester phosphodiesterase [Acidimicrobiales bacterium]
MASDIEEVLPPGNRKLDNPWLERRVLAYAHQGGAWEAPSSTLHAIRCALAAGATGIELDVHATVDGELVVCHDATVDRTTNGTGAIASMTLAEIRRLDNGYWFVPGSDVSPGLPPETYPYRGRAPEDPDLRIATVREVLELLERFPGVALNLDIKQTAPTVEPYEEPLARLLAEHGWRDDVIVASFLDGATSRFSELEPDLPTSAGMLAVGAFWQTVHDGREPPALLAVALQVPETYGEVVVVDERFVEAAHEAGIAVHVWTVNDEAAMRRLVALGVDGIISDVPTTLSRVLGDLGASWRPPGAAAG